MSLLHIAEPGESGSRASCLQRVIGIDLGTTHSLVAVVQDGRPQCLPDERGNPLLPSVVYYPLTGAPVVGVAAWPHTLSEPERTFVSIKRWMGRSPQEVQANPWHAIQPAEEGEMAVARFALPGKPHEPARLLTPVEISAALLRALRVRAEAFLQGTVEGAVITVPAYFDEAQRQATKDAGRLAGLPVLRLLNEPTAAALAYGLDQNAQGLFAVYDLGGGTFDVSLLELHEGVFTVLATAGDTALGGDDMDRALAERLVQKHPQAAAVQQHMATDPTWRTWLLQAARAAKHALTTEESTSVACPAPFAATLVVTRTELEDTVHPLLERTARPCRQVLNDANRAPSDLQGVVLVGGTTRMPVVRRYVEQLFGQPPLCNLNPDEVVALGAAIQADVIANRRKDVLLVDVNPLSLGLGLMGDVVEHFIPRNSRIPTVARQVFTTYADNQTGFDLHVVQGERETVSGCRSLARFQLTGIPPMVAGMARLEVAFLLDENGLLHVSARELLSDKEAHIEVRPSHGVTEAEIERMVAESEQHAAEDMQQRLAQETRVEAERLLSALNRAWQEDAHLLDADEQDELQRAQTAMTEALCGQDEHHVAACKTRLETASHALAERRMNQSVAQALTGKAVQTVTQMVEDEHA